MKKLHAVAFALAILPFAAMAADQGLYYVAAGAGTGGANYSIGAGTNVDILEISSIKLGGVEGNGSARFEGLSLVQNATPVHDFNLMFRVGFGRTTTTFANGASAIRTGFSNGVIFGLGGQYQLNRHLAVRSELNRITYAASADGRLVGIGYPVSVSALVSF
ncbi:hypothetical protein MIZ01_1194 [Sideroxyarcus emersonii]|uniref:Outer membrane protein beta-barrel domain-containing protein n=1 Tax=Sideroxyarcus emersonii TaxID=2764705 RepID=A0AAN1X9K1_9PROT|nr:hypothetical protein [Sideroxyarcus emersonii]BCK87416.1 hypothetical protein MIZ01_1194 [Sideroxyarcus emersonii]